MLLGKPSASNASSNLEPIPKLSMNRNEFAPDNHSAGKMNESKVISSFLFITDEEFPKAIEKRVRDFNNPTAGMEVRIAFQFHLFLATGPDMRDITALFHFS